MQITVQRRRLLIPIVARLPGLLLLPILAAVISTGCGKPESAGEPRVGAILFQEDQFFRMIEIGMKDAADRRGVQLSVNNSRNDPDEELRLIDTAKTVRDRFHGSRRGR